MLDVHAWSYVISGFKIGGVKIKEKKAVTLDQYLIFECYSSLSNTREK